MSVLVSTTTATTASDIIQGALELCQVVAAGEAVSAEDSALCLRALNGILKELPIHGIGWPQVSSTNAAIGWSSGTPAIVAVPSDYFGVPVLRFTDAGGVLQPLRQLAKVEYEALDATDTAEYPQAFYVAPDSTIYLWPVPTLDPGLTLSYQAIVGDVALTAAPNVQQAYLLGLQYWLAEEVKLKFNVTGALSQEIEKKFLQKRAQMQQWAVEIVPLSFSVAD